MPRIRFMGPSLSVLTWIIIIGICCIAVLIIGFNIHFLVKNWSKVLFVVFTLISAFFFVRDIFKPFYRFVYKLKAILLNKQVSWSLISKFTDSQISHKTFLKLKDTLRRIGNNKDLIYEDENQLKIQIDGINIVTDFNYIDNNDIHSENDYLGEITIYIPQYKAAYLETNERLNDEIIPILNHLSKENGIKNMSFNLDVFFSKNHPFMGMYITNISKSNIVSFSCEFSDSGNIANIKEKNIVKIGKNRMTIYTEDVASLHRSISRHLFLSGG